MDPSIKKLISEINSSDQNLNSHNDFIKTLELILGKNIFHIFSSKTFEINAKQQLNNKNWPDILFIAGVSSIATGCISAFGVLNIFGPPTSSKLVIGGVLLVAGIAMISRGKFIKGKPSTDDYNKLTEGASDPEVARVILDWAAWLISSKIPLFQAKGKNNKITKIPTNYREAKNMVMVLLGDDQHRQALGVKRQISDTPFLYNRDDTLKIFAPLVEALSQTKEYSKFKDHINSSSENFETTPIHQPSSDKTSKLIDIEPITAKPKTAKPEEGRGVKRYRQSRTVLLKRDALERVLAVLEDEEYYAQYVKSFYKRKLWVLALRYIFDHWDEWEAYRDSGHLVGNEKFVNKLFGPEILNETNTTNRNNFRRGMNTYLNTMIAATGALDEDILVSEETKIK